MQIRKSTHVVNINYLYLLESLEVANLMWWKELAIQEAALSSESLAQSYLLEDLSYIAAAAEMLDCCKAPDGMLFVQLQEVVKSTD